MLEHGGNLRDAARYDGRDDWIDLSTGINPHGYPAPAPSPGAWLRLPEPDPALLAAACAYYQARPVARRRVGAIVCRARAPLGPA
jgi:cobalamin biosynthetic protein CobC